MQSKYGEKKIGPGGAARPRGGRDSSGLGQTSRPTSAVFVGRCEGLKGYIYDYGATSHPELYRRSKEAMIDYIRVEYDEGDAVAESILGRGAQYPNKPVNPPAGASRIDEEIWKR